MVARLLLAVLVSHAPFAVSPVRAESAFLRELKAGNAHHLAKSPVLREAARPPAIER